MGTPSAGSMKLRGPKGGLVGCRVVGWWGGVVVVGLLVWWIWVVVVEVTVDI